MRYELRNAPEGLVIAASDCYTHLRLIAATLWDHHRMMFPQLYLVDTSTIAGPAVRSTLMWRNGISVRQ